MANYQTIQKVNNFESLIEYLRDELDWDFQAEDIEDLTFDYEPEELGLDEATAAKIDGIKQLRPLTNNQTWGIFYIDFEPKKLPIVALRRILSKLVIKRRISANQSDRAAWQMHDLLFLSSYGENRTRTISLAHFSDNSEFGDLPTLKTITWNNLDTPLHLQHAHQTLIEKLRFPDNPNDAKAWREQWASAFTQRHGEVIRTSKQLAFRLAELADNIRNRANEILNLENEKGELRKLHKAFQEALIHDLSYDDFADMYAQTISYGLLTAKISRPAGLVADNIADMIPVTNPFLKELLQTFLVVGGRGNLIDFDELGINDVVEMLRRADMEAVLRDFGDRNPTEDPAIHFYELFLKEYDPEKRMKRGVFYTPRPVVSFIVRSVHEILQKEFDLTDGLADTTTWGEMKSRLSEPPAVAGGFKFEIPAGVKETAPFVQILDPATGTGTFLVEVIEQIHKTLEAKWQQAGKSKAEQIEAWNEYVPKNLLPRLYGFELMMAPYSIAHMKIGLKLSETGYRFLSSERAQIYLTNTLEEPKDFSDYFAVMSPALAHEAEAANRVKRHTPITVVIGNPPYSGHSDNIGEWIMNLLRGKDTMTNEATGNYFEVDGQSLNERNPKWLNDDYVKFIRYSQRITERARVGLLAFISNNGYLDNPTFRGMRQSLTETYNKIYLLDLHGSAKKKEKHPDGSKDENVFDIEQGVGIGAFISSPNKETAQISHAHLFGVREVSNESNGKLGKYQWLLRNEIGTAELTKLEPQNPFYLFVPQDIYLLPEYENYSKITDIMPMNNVGIVTSRDKFVFDSDEKKLKSRITDFIDLSISDNEIKSEYLSDKDKLPVNKARNKVYLDRKQIEKFFVKCLYRPFDVLHLFYHDAVIERSRREIMQHITNKPNYGLISRRQMIASKPCNYFFATEFPMSDGVIRSDNQGGESFFPLYLYPTEKEKAFGATERVPNFSDEFIEEFSNKLGLEFVYDGEVRTAYGSGRLNTDSSTVGDNLNASNSKLQPSATADGSDKFTPEDVFAYAYAVFHSPTYRVRYAEFLKIDFPRLPLTTDRELFRKLCASGNQLVQAHLLESIAAPPAWNLQTDGTALFQNHEVAAGFPKKELAEIDAQRKGKVYINKTTYFAEIPEPVWNFHIGGYQVCHKWLKDRKTRTLSEEDIAHYGKIVVALGETIRLMAEIDQTIEEHGGFPLVGSQEN